VTTGVILDTGPLVALLDRSEQRHAWAKTQLETIKPPLVTCEAVIAEACYLLRAHTVAANHIGRFVAAGVIQVPFSIQAEHAPVFQLMRKYSDVPMSIADACIVRMTEIGLGRLVFTLDSDFHVYRQKGRRRIDLITP
jgi:predicted nucleic acid-binding protein